jgi:membrane associated rhomboid family serine protease
MSYYRQGPTRPSGSGVRLGVPGLTPYVKLIMIACGAVWLVQFFALATARFDLMPYLGMRPDMVIRGWLWQPVTYMFLHDPAGPFHLILNMLMLWMFGGELERYWGSRAFLRYYLICGIGAGLLSIPYAYAFGTQGIVTVGASGAIYGLFMAFGMVFAERTVLFMMLFPMKARTMAMIMFGVAFFYAVTQPRGGVAHIAHLGGAVVGYLYLKRAWRVGEFFRDLKWKIRRRRFKVMPPNDRDDFDQWVN